MIDFKTIVAKMQYMTLKTLKLECLRIRSAQVCFCFPIELLIFIYYFNGAVDMQICTPLTISQCKVSDTQVTVRPEGLMLKINFEKSQG